MPSRTGQIFFALFGALALLSLNVHCGSAQVPRLVLSGRMSVLEGPRGRHVEQAAMASLTLPLDSAQVPAIDPGTARMESALDAREPLSIDPRILDARTDEPSVESLVHAALASHRFDPGRATEARDRARLAGLMPQVRVGVRRGTGWDLRTQQTSTSDSAVLANDDSWSVVGTATFRLDRLIFTPEESSLFVEERRLEELRLRLVREIVHAYYERLRLLWEERQGPSQPARILEIAELEAMLDVWTEGAFQAARGQ